MSTTSIGHASDFIFSRFSGKLLRRDGYIVVQTPRNPGFYWGNYLVFNEAPKSGDVDRWMEIFRNEFTYYERYDHYAFTWENSDCDASVIDEFLKAGFEIEHIAVLASYQVNPPPRTNSEIRIEKIHTAAGWEAVIDNQVLCAEERYDKEKYRGFKERQFAEYRKMSEAGLGDWFGAYSGDQLVGDLGIYFDGKVGRYQNVGVHPDHRRKGICGSLVYETGKMALSGYPLEQLVMKADDDYFAARIYESVGFRKVEINHCLCWSSLWNQQKPDAVK